MDEQLRFDCDTHNDPFDCPDQLILYNEKFDEYSIIIHDGGTSSVNIEFCPWCGKKLPKTKRDAWFNIIENLGLEPDSPNIPKEYLSNEWWLNDQRKH